VRDGANAVVRIVYAVAVDGAGDNDAACVAVVTDHLQLTIATEAASCIAPGDTGSSHVRSTALAHSRPSGLTSRLYEVVRTNFSADFWTLSNF